MTNRREFLQIGASATAWPLVARAAEAAGLDASVAVPSIALAVFDARFPESVAFAERGAALGVETRAITADMTRLWYGEVYHRWQRGPEPIAGLTAHGALFCFAELARDVRMRVVFRAEHRVPGETLYRWVIAPCRGADLRESMGWPYRLA